MIERRFFEKLNLNCQKSNAKGVNWEKVSSRGKHNFESRIIATHRQMKKFAT